MQSRLPSLYQEMIHLSRYARWIDDSRRRETWEETVGRYVDFMCDVQCKGKIPKEVKEDIRKAVLGLEVMPSMRCMMTASLRARATMAFLAPVRALMRCAQSSSGLLV